MKNVIVVGKIVRIEEKTFTRKDGTTFVSKDISVLAHSVRNADGTFNSEFVNTLQSKNAFTDGLKKGDLICINGQEVIHPYVGQDGIAKVSVSINGTVNRILSAPVDPTQGAVPQVPVTGVQGAVSQAPQAQPAPQYGAPQGYTQPQVPQGYPQAPQGYAQPNYQQPAAPQYEMPSLSDDDLPF